MCYIDDEPQAVVSCFHYDALDEDLEMVFAYVHDDVWPCLVGTKSRDRRVVFSNMRVER